MNLIEITKIHSWLLQKLKADAAIRPETLQLLEEDDRSRAHLFLDYLVGQGVLSARSVGSSIEYRVEDHAKIAAIERPRPSTAVQSRGEAPTAARLVYSAPASLIGEMQGLVAKYPNLQVVPLEEALKEVISQAKHRLQVAVPFLEWDGLGYLISEFKAAARRDVHISLLTRGVLVPESSEYGHLEKAKTLLKMFAVYEAHASSPEARLEVRDFTTRIANPGRVSIHYEGIHQKMVVADQDVAYVGSGEIRAASFLVNGECGVVQTGPPAAFWGDFFQVFWKAARPVPKSSLEAALKISMG